MNEVIETNRLCLRPFVEDDIDPLFLIQSDPIAMQYTVCAKTREAAARRLRAYAREKDELGFAPWTVVLRSEDRIIGWGGLNVDPFDPGWGVEVIYFFHPAYWGRGFAGELVKTSVDIGFALHRLEEINAFAHRDNKASIRVLEKNGFRYLGYEERLERNHYRICQPVT
ncbi:MAG TPA: GNAT family N-acetyltransferase [Anaerolineae bacterium]|nr:GNAT family N-acetyltransferase [Anaerolineae bacterium]